MKAYTDLEQSRKLTEILPIESADGGWYGTNNPLAANNTFWLHTKYSNKASFPAWSLATLLRELPETILGKDKDGCVVMVETKGGGLTTFADDPVDACYEMILKLHEQKLL